MNEAERQATRLKDCGLVYHERLINGHCWIGPPGDTPGEKGRIKVLALNFVEPKPQMEIHALPDAQHPQGERFLLAHDFTGTWFDVRSPTGRILISHFAPDDALRNLFTQ